MTQEFKILRWLIYPIILIVGLFLLIVFSPMEAAHRSPVSRARSDMRSTATALESYYVDNNSFPAWTVNRQSSINGGRKAWDNLLERQPTFMISNVERPDLASLTTPVSYLTNFFTDPYGPQKRNVFSYYSANAGWILWSAGPDRDYDLSIDNIPNIYDPADTTTTLRRLNSFTYAPTNGSISNGDIWHIKH